MLRGADNQLMGTLNNVAPLEVSALGEQDKIDPAVSAFVASHSAPFLAQVVAEIRAVDVGFIKRVQELDIVANVNNLLQLQASPRASSAASPRKSESAPPPPPRDHRGTAVDEFSPVSPVFTKKLTELQEFATATYVDVSLSLSLLLSLSLSLSLLLSLSQHEFIVSTITFSRSFLN